MKRKSIAFKAKHDKYVEAKNRKASAGSYSRSYNRKTPGSGKTDLNEIEIVSYKLNKLERFSYKVLRLIGLALVSFSLIYLFFAFLPIVRQELSSLFTKRSTEQGTILLSEKPLNDSKGAIEEATSLGLDPNFSIYVPKIDAKGNIAPNVDTSNEAEYLNVLKSHVAHAKGSYFPGQGKMIYLFSHSTDSSLNAVKYNAVFYLLTELKPNDLIIVFFSNREYVYKVAETSVRSPSDTSFLDDVYSKETLVLQTCYPPGTTLKRFLVYANRLDN